MNHEVTDNRTMPAAQAKRYLLALRARGVAYNYQPVSHDLIMVSTHACYARESYEAFLESARVTLNTDSLQSFTKYTLVICYAVNRRL